MISVTCAIIQRDDKILAAQRGQDTHLSGKWEFPGGKVDEGESEEDCIIREIREELGVEVTPTSRLSENVHDYGDKQIRLIPFQCELVSGEPVAREHASLRWVSIHDLADLTWCEADVPIVEQLSTLTE
jgi:8-oxo-dGTP diphosphatase